ncbi:hypothetical protein [Laspinema olomoucense]|uniref:hypothetical protein n=1 Tax=Laspinema olomoucense TaxID=3231600 RepID=UPI0021BAD749|nr:MULTISPECIES: hypothetical protein [unclassified Laspinema]MCT7973175.1 hypothetical protein [Laspinema sp. D3d]MCT7990875.1 hypothetical protein [Laspinema sp. D3a]
MQIKKIKQGRTIEIFDDLDIPDGQEISLSLETGGEFWQRLLPFRQEQDSEGIWIEPDVFDGVRDSSSG